MSQNSPWTARFASLLDPNVIRRLTRRVPPPLTYLDELSLEVACKDLSDAFEELFIPTAQTVAIFLEFVGLALAHSRATYPNARTFMQGIYAKMSPLPELSVIICLTGLAGVGKSHLIKALHRMLGAEGRVLADPEHSEFPLISAWFLNVREKTTITKMFLSLMGKEETEADALSELETLPFEKPSATKKRRRKESHHITQLLKSCRFRAFKDGVSLLPADEFQFVTRSDQAHALVASTLLHLAAIGPPLIYGANFSLCHRILKRPQEDVQRLLGRRIVLLPDPANSEDWLITVLAYRNIAPQVFVFNPKEVAEALHGWTAGLKRLLGRLLVIAYRRARNTGKYVGFAEIEWAYHSAAYSIEREDVKLIKQQNITHKMARKDLWCPFELPEPEIVKENADENKRQSGMGSLLVSSALTDDERKICKQLEKAARNSTPSTKTQAVNKNNKGAISVGELLRGEQALRTMTRSRKAKS